MTLTLRQLEIISLPFGSNLNLEREALCGSSSENSSVNLYRAKYEPNAFCGFVVNDLFFRYVFRMLHSPLRKRGIFN